MAPSFSSFYFGKIVEWGYISPLFPRDAGYVSHHFWKWRAVWSAREYADRTCAGVRE